MADGKPGRPKGLPKTGGRGAGALNKRPVVEKSGVRLMNELRATGRLTPAQIDALQPCDVMRMVMIQGVEDRDMKTAFMAANALAPYVHAKLQAVTVRGDDTAPLLVEQAVKLVDERKPVEVFLSEWQPKLIEGEAAD